MKRELYESAKHQVALANELLYEYEQMEKCLTRYEDICERVAISADQLEARLQEEASDLPRGSYRQEVERLLERLRDGQDERWDRLRFACSLLRYLPPEREQATARHTYKALQELPF
jgi:hypothetical protein